MKKNVFDIMHSATQKAFARMDKATGRESDPALRIYNQLRPEHFTELMKKFGEPEVIQYIQTMESKRMGGKHA